MQTLPVPTSFKTPPNSVFNGDPFASQVAYAELYPVYSKVSPSK